MSPITERELTAAKVKLSGAILLLVLCALAMLAGCEAHGSSTPPDPRTYPATLNIYIDAETGCQYIGQWSSSAGITPRLGRDGKQICREVRS
jgi:hypothetical protein